MKNLHTLRNALLFGAALTSAAVIIGSSSPAEATHGSWFGQTTVFGRSYAGWSARWWKWVRSFPTAQSPSDPQNPLLEGDPNNFVPVDCSRGQRGLVWFLPGTGGGTLKRSCDIPRGRALFFPLVNAMFWNARSTDVCTADSDCNAGSVCDAGFCKENVSVEDKRGILAGFFDGACNPVAELDGRPLVFDNVATVRAQSRPFRTVAGPNDVFGGIDGEVDRRAISDGVWALIPHLSPGAHTLRFGGGVCLGGQEVFSTEAIYELNVTR